ncbi:MAG TPA: autotransporter-associated beta strand repeat-containing protein, partial [Pirellulales bacterium]|nr:autotransporter-associated beta strand repeat-containing protein [Pirellulales bacterium]
SGGMTIGAGTLQVGGNTATGTPGAGPLLDNASLVCDLSGTATIANAISGSGTVTQSSYGTLVLTGDNSYGGTTTISAGTLQVGAGGTTGTLGAGNVTGSYTVLAFDRSDNVMVGNPLGGTISLVQEGTGILTLTGSNTYTGSTTVNASGTLQVGSGDANVLPNGVGTGTVVVNGTLDLNGYSPTLGGLSGSGTVTSSAAGTGTLSVGNNNQASTFAGFIQDGSGTVSVTKVGTNTLTLTGKNTFSGGMTIGAGTLQVGGNTAAGTPGAGPVVDNASLVLYLSGTAAIANAISGSGTVTQSSYGTLILTGNNTYTGTTTINAGTLQIGAGGTTGSLGTGSVTGNDTVLAFDRGDDVTVGNSLGGNIGVVQEGTGILTLTGSNTYTANTTVNAGGTLQVGSSDANVLPNGAGTGTVVVNGTLDLNGYSPTIGGLGGSGTVTSGVAGTSTLSVGNNDQSSSFAGVIQDGSGTVSFTKVGTNTLTLTGSNTYSGGTTISAGTLQVGGNTATGTLGSGAVVDNASLVFDLSGTATIANAISGSGTLAQSSSGTLILTGNNTYTRTTTIDYGTLQIGAGGTTGSLGTGSVTGSYTTLAFDRSDNVTVGNALGGAIGVVQQGTGTLTLTGNNTYTGSTTINAGSTLQVGNPSVLGTGSVAVNGTLDLNGYGATVGGLSGSGTVTSSVAGTSTLTVGNNSEASTFAGVVQDGSGTVALAKVGSSALTLTGSNTFSGGTTITAGTLAFASGALNASGAVTFAGNATLQWYGNNTQALSSDFVLDPGVNATLDVGSNIVALAAGIAGSASLTKAGTGTLILTGNSTYTGTTTISAGTLQVGAGGTTGSLGTGSVTGSYTTLAFDRSDNVTVGNALGGAIGVVQQGTGTLTLTGNNTYTGSTTINAGSTLQVGNPSVLGTGSVAVNGTLDLNGYGATVGGLSGSGTVTSSVAGTSTLTVGNNSEASTFAGVVQDGSGTVALAKVGSSALTLTGSNTFSGGTTITAGTLAFASGALNASGAVTFAGNATLQWYGNNTQALSSDFVLDPGVNATLDVGSNIVALAAGIAGSASLTKAGTGTLILTGNSTYTGTTTISAGTLQVGAGGTTGSLGTGAVNGSYGILAFDRSDNVTLSNLLSGSISVIEEGSGILTLAASDTFSGGTTIDAGGTLQMGNPTALGTGIVTADGTLDVNGENATIAGLGGSGTVTSGTAGAVTLTLNATVYYSSTFAGVIQDGSGTVALAKQGTGTLTLTGNNTYMGGTTLSAGTLSFASGALGSSGAITFAGNATLQWYGSNTQDVSGRLVVTSGVNATLDVGYNTLTLATGIGGGGALTKAGAGTLIFTGDNTYSGTTTINAGMLQIGAGGTTGSLGSGTVNGGYAVLAFDRSDNVTVANTLGGAISVVQEGTGVLALTGSNTYTGGTTISAGETLQVGNPSPLGTGVVTVNGTLDLNGFSPTLGGLSGSGTVTTNVAGSVTLTVNPSYYPSGMFSGVIEDGSGTLSLAKAGLGVQTLTGANAYSGGTTIGAGTLAFASGGLATTGAITFGGNATLQWDSGNSEDISSRLAVDSGMDATLDVGTNTVTLATGLGGGGALTKAGAGTLVFTGNNSYTGATTISSGTLQIGAGGTTGNLGTGAVNGSNGTLAFDRGDDVTVGNTLGGAISVVQEGAGTLTLTGSNTYTGSTTVNAGSTLQVGSSNANVLPNGPGTGTMVVNGMLDLNGFSPTIGGLGGSGTVTTSDAGTGTLSVGNDNLTSTFAGVVQDGSGTVALAKVGSGTLTLTGTDIYSGGTTISAGTLAFASGGLATTGAITFGGNATLQWDSGNSEDISSRLAVDSGMDATLDVGTNTVTLATGLGGGGALTKAGAGTLVFTGNNSYTGATTISSGTLQIGAGGTTGNLGSGNVAGSSGTLAFDRSDNVTLGNILSGSISIVQDGAGIVTLTASNTYSGGTTINAGGTVQVGNASALGTGAVTVNGTLDLNGYSVTVGGLSGNGAVTSSVAGAATLTVAGSQDSTFSGTIEDGAGTVAVTNSGTNTLALAGTSTYSGATTVSQGGLSVAGVLNTGSLAFSSTSAYDVSLTDDSLGQINVAGAVTLGNATLNVTSIRTHEDGDALVLINNQSADPVSGTFQGLPEGSVVPADNFAYRITYDYNADTGTLGTGNDVALIGPPATPVLTATPASDSEIDLQWTDTATDVAGYTIDRGDGDTWTQIATVPGDVTSYSDTAFTEGTFEYYQVQASDGTLHSASSNMAYATTLPTAPSALQATPLSGSQMDLQWQNNSSIETGYSIDQLVNGVWQEVGSTPAGQTSLTIAGSYTPSTEYSFEVRATANAEYSGDQYSLPSGVASVTTPAWPSAPTNLSATAASDTEIDLNWTDNSTAATNYEVERSPDGTTWAVLATVGPDATSYADSGITAGEQVLFYYRVRATGNGVGDSAYTNVTSAQTLLTAPTNLAASIVDGSQVHLTWRDNSPTATTDPISELINGTWQQVQTVAVGVDSAAIIGTFDPGNEYSFQVDAQIATDS